METNHASPKKPGLIRRFFRLISKLVSGLRTFINLAILIVFLVFIASLFQKDIEPLPDNAALRLAIEGVLVDQKSYTDPFTQALTEGQDKVDSETLLRDVIDAINYAANDSRINSLVLDLGNMQGGGLSKLEEIGQALTAFKSTHKPIIAIGDNYTQAQYYLASFADEIHLNPMGSVILTGFGSYPNYFQDALDKLKITVNIFRVGQYKDAIEPFSRSNMSEASKEHTRLWLNSLWQLYTSTVEQQRNLPPEAIDDYANNLDSKLAAQAGNSARLAKASGLVDYLSTKPQILEHLQQKVGTDIDFDYQHIDVKNYVSHIRRIPVAKKLASDGTTAANIAVIVASGMIVDGEQPAGTIGSESLAALLQQVQSGDYKALILRVDSPGGSAFAAEVIRQQLKQIQNKNIPVIVSMSSVAASGGYWISAGASQIWANPSTITGSIGVFGVIPTFDQSLQSLGITSDGVGTTEIADIMRLDRPMSDTAKKIVQMNVENIYSQFINLVADNRGMSPKAVDQIAQGHVWSGIKAQELGLVDKLGTFADVVDATAALLGVKDYQLDYLKPPMSFYEQILQQLSQTSINILTHTGISEWIVSQQTPLLILARPIENYLGTLKMLNDSRHTYLQCFECQL